MFSSVLPKNNTGGELLLYRHLSLLTDWSVTVLCPKVSACDLEFEHIYLPINTFWDRLRNTPLRKLANTYIELTGRFSYKKVRQIVKKQRPNVILTVAHGEFYWPAMKIANELNIPLVTMYHDWYPDLVSVYSSAKKILENRFQQLGHVSDACLCVTAKLIERLNAPSSAVQLYPIPENLLQPSEVPKSNGKRLSIGYAGNLKDPYGYQIFDLIKVLSRQNSNIDLNIVGNRPDWLSSCSADEKQYYKGFLTVLELKQFLAAQDVLLVVMSFDPKDKRRMETSFPSKLVQYCQYGKPIIIWGPEYCSGVRWARETDAAVCVTDRHPEKMIEEVVALKSCSNRFDFLASQALFHANTTFSTKRLQESFEKTLNKVVKS